jgi:hypothetical protein
MEGVIRYRLRWRQVAPQALPLALGITFNLWSPAGSPYVIASLLASAGIVAAGQRAFGVELRPDALVLYGLRRRIIPWSQIGVISVSSLLGQRYIRVYADGRDWSLRAPTHMKVLAPDPEFDAKLAMICWTWEQRRGPQWRPPMWQAPMVQASAS